MKTDANAEEGRPRGLYGNVFGRTALPVIRKAIKRITPPTVSNIIAMAALGYGSGAYTAEQINDTFATAFTSFRAAVFESVRVAEQQQQQLLQQQQHKEETKKQEAQPVSSSFSSSSSSSSSEKSAAVSHVTSSPPRVVIHTGNWGTGAFGGSKSLMALLQLAAASLSGVDMLVYHTFDKSGSEGYKEGWKEFSELVREGGSVEEFLKRVADMNISWGMSDGN